MGKKSYTNGRKFEIQICWWFRENGYYPEYHEKSASGSQNGDITVIKNNIATKVECKTLEAKNRIISIIKNRAESNFELSGV